MQLGTKISGGGGVGGNTTMQEGVFEEFSLKYGQFPLVEFVEESGVI